MGVRSLCAALVILTSASALAAGGASSVQRAAEHFDEGSRAFQSNRFEQAASHFEAAFSAVPNARALRNAMRARDLADQPARAATLAALGLSRYPEDAETMKTASELLAKHGQALAYFNVRCVSRCLIAANGLMIVGGVDTQHSVYLKPGKVRFIASFENGGEAEQSMVARAGATVDIELAPERRPADATAETGAPPSALGQLPESKRKSKREEHSEERALRAPVALSARNDSAWYESRGLFATAMVATAAVGGVTIWSGIDTLNDPGKDGVRAACVGLGTDCPEYQRGLEKQNRTNILIGATAGAGFVTLLVGSLLTDFSSAERTAVSWNLSASPEGAGAAVSGSF